MLKRILESSILMFWIILLNSSCASRKDIVYLQRDSVVLNQTFSSNFPKLKTGDVLAISVTGDDIRAIVPFNLVSTYQNGTIQNSSPFIPTYIIDEKGNIDFPKLGKIHLAGMSRIEAIKYLKNEVGKYVVNSGVTIEIRNFGVTVLGEVNKPGNYLVNEGRITVLEALALAGDLTIYGKRNDILVIREENGIKKEYRIDLTKRESLNSPVYYLSQNDFIYVEPNGARIQASKYSPNVSIFVSIIGLIITVISVISRS